MKQEVKQIFEMVRAGRLTDEQAARLMTEIQSKETRFADKDGFPGSMLRNIRADVGALSSSVDGLYASSLKENDFSMSRVQAPVGKSFVFEGNSIRMSSLGGLHLEDAEFSGNEIHSSNIQDLAMKSSKFSGTSLTASSIENTELDKANAESLEISSSSMKKIRIHDSEIKQARMIASSLKELNFTENTTWSGAFDKSQISNLTLKKSQMSDFEVLASQVSQMRFEETEGMQVLIRMLKMTGTSFLKCKMSDVLFSGGEKWRKGGFKNVAFENVSMEKVLFSDCSLDDTVIRNVNLKDVRILNANLRGKTIESTEEFLKLCETKAA